MYTLNRPRLLQWHVEENIMVHLPKKAIRSLSSCECVVEWKGFQFVIFQDISLSSTTNPDCDRTTLSVLFPPLLESAVIWLVYTRVNSCKNVEDIHYRPTGNLTTSFQIIPSACIYCAKQNPSSLTILLYSHCFRPIAPMTVLHLWKCMWRWHSL